MIAIETDENEHIFNLETFEKIKTISGFENDLYWSSDGSKFVTDVNNRSKLYRTDTEEFMFDVHDGEVYFVSFSNDGLKVAVLFDDRNLKVWDIMSESILFTIVPEEDIDIDGRDLTFSSDSTKIAFVYNYTQIKTFDSSTGEELLSIDVDCLKIISIRFINNDHVIVDLKTEFSRNMCVYSVNEKKLYGGSLTNEIFTNEPLGFSLNGSVYFMEHEDKIEIRNVPLNRNDEFEIISVIQNRKFTDFYLNHDGTKIACVFKNTVTFFDLTTCNQIGKITVDSDVLYVDFNTVENVESYV